jgi:hypothetical protein
MPETLVPRSKEEGEAREKTPGGRLAKGKMGWGNAMALPQSGLL